MKTTAVAMGKKKTVYKSDIPELHTEVNYMRVASMWSCEECYCPQSYHDSMHMKWCSKAEPNKLKRWFYKLIYD